MLLEIKAVTQFVRGMWLFFIISDFDLNFHLDMGITKLYERPNWKIY